MPGDTFESFTSRSGEPIFRFLTGVSDAQRRLCDIPYECCVFKIDHVTEVMAVSRYGNKDEWHANCGERAIIKELLRRAADTKVDLQNSIQHSNGAEPTEITPCIGCGKPMAVHEVKLCASCATNFEKPA
jgi:hypothetical protein